jgi:HD-GYP domain-containing protein (c-di-GMP phosphodiesterase class II)
MLGGLLHDIGEVYIQPSYLDSSDALDLIGYKHVAAHPRAAQLLLSTNTDYPEALSRAIGEHHERLDGSGYPARLHADKISPLGRLLAVVEVTMGIMRAPVAPLTRASFALRVIPGEFDPKWTGLVCDAARDAGEVLQSMPSGAQGNLGAPLQEIEIHTERARQVEKVLQQQHPKSPAIDIAAKALQRLARLRVAWNGLGIWGLDTQEPSAQEQFEIDMAGKELKQHLRELQRECLLLSERLNQPEREAIEPLWQGLLVGTKK